MESVNRAENEDSAGSNPIAVAVKMRRGADSATAFRRSAFAEVPEAQSVFADTPGRVRAVDCKVLQIFALHLQCISRWRVAPRSVSTARVISVQNQYGCVPVVPEPTSFRGAESPRALARRFSLSSGILHPSKVEHRSETTGKQLAAVEANILSALPKDRLAKLG
jgi:hypothetical protein